MSLRHLVIALLLKVDMAIEAEIHVREYQGADRRICGIRHRSLRSIGDFRYFAEFTERPTVRYPAGLGFLLRLAFEPSCEQGLHRGASKVSGTLLACSLDSACALDRLKHVCNYRLVSRL